MGDVIPFPKAPVPQGLGTALLDFDEAMVELRRLCAERDKLIAASIEAMSPPPTKYVLRDGED